MKKILILLALLPFVVHAQPQAEPRITDTTSLRSYINAEIVTNGTKAITAYKMNRILNGLMNTWPGTGGSQLGQKSVLKTGNVFTLLNDETSPGNNKFYGTNASGVKGWYAGAGGGGGGSTYFAAKSVALSTGTFSLVNDLTTPGNNKVYSTNASGVRGWNTVKTDTTDLLGITRVAVFKTVAEMRASTVFTMGAVLGVTQGYYDSADGGGAEYIYIASNTDADDSSFTINPAGPGGRLKLQFVDNVSILQIGGKRNWTYGAGTGFDNSWTFAKAQANSAVGRITFPASGILAYVGGAMTAPMYGFVDSLRLTRRIDIIGQGIENTLLYIPKGIVMEPLTKGSDIRNFSFFGGLGLGSTAYNSAEKHGIQIRSNQNNFFKVRAVGFSGDGWHTNSTGGNNANNNVYTECEGWYNGRNGWYAVGADANNLRIIGGDYSYNARFGCNYSGFLQAAFYSVHSASNGHQHPLNKTIVSKGGNYYSAIQDNTNYPPDSAGASAYWKLIPSFSPIFSTVWNRIETFYTGAGYGVTQANPHVGFYDCYVEPDQNVFIGNGRALPIGGELASYTSGLSVYADAERLIADNFFARDKTTAAGLEMETRNLKLGYINNSGQSHGLKWSGLNYAYWSASNNGTSDIYYVSYHADPAWNTTFFGNTAAPNGVDNAIVIKGGPFIGVDNALSATRLAYATVAPTTGWHKAGEFHIYHGTDPSTVGFRCTVSGTPGTWITVSTATTAVSLTNSSNALASDFFTTIDSWNDVTTLTLTAGTWLLTSNTTVRANGGAIATNSGFRIIKTSDNSIIASGDKGPMDSFEYATVSLSGIVTIASGSATLKVQARPTDTSYLQVKSTSSHSQDKASLLNAVKIQ